VRQLNFKREFQRRHIKEKLFRVHGNSIASSDVNDRLHNQRELAKKKKLEQSVMIPMALDHGSLEHLLPTGWKTQITTWLAEDTPSFDYGGFVVGEAPRTATLWGKSAGILAGVPFFDEVFSQCGCTVTWLAREGSHIELASSSSSAPAGRQALATVTGPARGLLLGERVALNILARCSGVASVSRGLLVNLRSAGYRGVLAGTRKTTPGFRLVEKYGMLVGGADTHRMDLSSMIMLKDNHIWSRGSITDAVLAAKAAGGFSLKVEVEVQSEEEADEAIAAGADVVMLDNFTGPGVKVAAKSLKEKWRGKREFLLEVSGGLRVDNAEDYVCNGKCNISSSPLLSPRTYFLTWPRRCRYSVHELHPSRCPPC
jgi:nicotinate-nucleotide pyrophosphorylase